MLVKPQFEADRAEVSRGKGVVRDPAVWSRALLEVACALGRAGTGIMGAMSSPLTGPAGNVEFLVHAVAGAAAPDDEALSTSVAGAVAEARSQPRVRSES